MSHFPSVISIPVPSLPTCTQKPNQMRGMLHGAGRMRKPSGWLFQRADLRERHGIRLGLVGTTDLCVSDVDL